MSELTGPIRAEGIDPHRPPDTLTYQLTQIAIPIVAVVFLLGFFRLRRVELERWPTA